MTFKIALIQLTSSADIAANITKIEKWVKQAATQGAELVALPENAFFIRDEKQPAPGFTEKSHPAVKASAQMAKQYRVWLLAGSVAVIPSARSKKFYNRSLLFNPQGKTAAQYNKIHMFDVDIGDGQVYRESARFLPGNKVVACDMCLVPGEKEDLQGIKRKAHATLGLSICYDLRFPHLYRALAKAGANILAVPSAFTQVTGEAHWHVLLRARAIENTCFVIAPAQAGEHPGGRKTYGHSLVVDPWGKILADGGTKEGVVMAEIDLEEVKRVRRKLPSLEHDREFE